MYIILERGYLVALMQGDFWSGKGSVDLMMPIIRLLTFSYWSIRNKLELICMVFNGMDISPVYLKDNMFPLVSGNLYNEFYFFLLSVFLQIIRHCNCEAIANTPIHLLIVHLSQEFYKSIPLLCSI